MRLLNTVYVTEHGSRVGYRSGSVRIIRRDGVQAKIPINAIDGIVLAAHAQVSGELMAECVRRSIPALTPSTSTGFRRPSGKPGSASADRCAATQASPG
jgi:CRISPR/Cas system-associated endonuclease Cas1